MAKYQFQEQKSDLNRHTRERPYCAFSQLKLFCPPHVCRLWVCHPMSAGMHPTVTLSRLTDLILDKWIHFYARTQGNDKSKDLNLASVYTQGLSLWSAPHTTRYSVYRFAILPPSISDICFNQSATWNAPFH